VATSGTSIGGKAPAPTKSLANFATLFFVMIAVLVLFDQNIRNALGEWVGYVFQPLFGFNYEYVVLTLMITGLIMASLTIIVRHFFTDYVEQAENQKIVSAFNTELRKARLENNTFKTKKLTEMQPEILQKSMKASSTQLKLMPVTLIIVIPIFAWLSVFMQDVHSPLVAVPWSYSVDLLATTLFFPNWVLLYSLISIPLGQVLARSLRYMDFRKRLREIAAEGNA
jgi:uncharacterized membrane protein (DUF106 family)